MYKKLKDLFKNVYKKIIIFIFKIIYPYPSLYKKNFTDKSVKKFKIAINENIYTLFKIYNGSIFTDSNDTTAFISEKNKIINASMQFYKFDKINSFNDKLSKNITLKIGTPKLRKKINGKVLSLLSGGASKDNFTHWFTDVIPRICIYEKKFKLKDIDKFYVPSYKYRYQIDSLKILCINKNKIISSENVKHLKADCIFATSHPCYYLPTKVKKWSIEYLNKKFKNKSNYKNYKKIFIDRDQLKIIDKNNLEKFKNYRVLLNEEEIKNHLTSKGYKIIKPENFSFKEQIKIFSSAKYIIGLYGAAMMMLAFCRKKTNVLEIKPIQGGNEFKNISRLRNLNHKQINLKPLIKSTTPLNGLLFCHINKIDKIINSF